MPCPAGPLIATVIVAAAMPSPSVVSIPNDEGQFCLTFDADAGGAGAAEVLELLRQRGVRATIFVTGRFAERFPALVRAAPADGHEIGNHTFDHPHLTTWAETGRHAEVSEVRVNALRRFPLPCSKMAKTTESSPKAH